MGETPDEIRVEIEQTRADMTETVEAIGYKADVPSRVKDSVTEKKDAALGAVSGAADSVTGAVKSAVSSVAGTISETMPDTEGVEQTVRKGVGMAKENPLGMAIGGAAVGFLAGLLLPHTRMEDEKLGPVAEDVREAVKETGQEAMERGKEVAQEAGQAAVETLRDRGQEESGELASHLKERAQEAGVRTGG
jgi:ElaB/YqjD/DUF883 family membrane-anchored ribosome-binding protein